jgi:hypothetical protein
MSTTPKDGGPAFPVPAPVCSGPNNSWEYPSDGMTLRDYFAAKAMQALISNARFEKASYQQFAFNAYYTADAMIAERAKTKGGAS